MNPFKVFGKAKDFFVRHNGIGLLLLLTIVAGSFLSKLEFSQVSGWAQGAMHKSVVNEKKLDHLETVVKQEANKPVPPPVIIVQETHAKPFTDPALLHAARRLRHEQKRAELDREHATSGQ